MNVEINTIKFFLLIHCVWCCCLSIITALLIALIAWLCSGDDNAENTKNNNFGTAGGLSKTNDILPMHLRCIELAASVLNPRKSDIKEKVIF